MSLTGRTISASGWSSTSTLYTDGVPTGDPRPARSRRCPAGRGRPPGPGFRAAPGAAAMLTAVVVLPTPPFWLAIVMIRQARGRGQGRPPPLRTSIATSAARPMGVSAAGPSAGPGRPGGRAGRVRRHPARRAGRAGRGLAGPGRVSPAQVRPRSFRLAVVGALSAPGARHSPSRHSPSAMVSRETSAASGQPRLPERCTEARAPPAGPRVPPAGPRHRPQRFCGRRGRKRDHRPVPGRASEDRCPRPSQAPQ